MWFFNLRNISLHLPPHGLRVSNPQSSLFKVKVAGRTKLYEAGEQVAVLFFGLSYAVMDHGSVTAYTAKLWQRGVNKK